MVPQFVRQVWVSYRSQRGVKTNLRHRKWPSRNTGLTHENSMVDLSSSFFMFTFTRPGNPGCKIHPVGPANWLVVDHQPLWKMMDESLVGMIFPFPTEWKQIKKNVPNHQADYNSCGNPAALWKIILGDSETAILFVNDFDVTLEMNGPYLMSGWCGLVQRKKGVLL